MKIFEEVADEIGVADVHLSIGDICFAQRDYHKALGLELFPRTQTTKALLERSQTNVAWNSFPLQKRFEKTGHLAWPARGYAKINPEIPTQTLPA